MVLRSPSPAVSPVPFLDGAPEGWNQGLTQAPGVVAAAISDADGFAVYVSMDGGPARELVRSPEWLAIGGVEQGRSRPRRSVRRRLSPRPGARRPRRHHPPVAAGGGPTHRGDRRRTPRRRSGPVRRRLVTGARGPTTRRLPRTGRGLQPGGLGPVRRGVARPRRRPRRPGLGGRLVARRRGPSCSPTTTRAGPPVPVRPGDGLVPASRGPRRVDRRCPGPARR